MSLVVVGSVAFDTIETPFGKVERVLGGAGTYIGLAASSFDIEPKLISVVGNDFLEKDLEMLKNKQINTIGIQQKADEKSFFWKGRYSNNMNHRESLATELNVLGEFDPIVPKSYQGAEYLMLGNLSPVVQRKVIERMEKRPKLIVMDTMNFWMDIMIDELHQTISLVDVLTINDEEARQLSGEYSLLTAAQKILAMGPKYLIIKKGEHGALLFDKENIFSAPALLLEKVVDPTGAGDTFAGGFIGYLAQCQDISFESMKTAVIVASAVASCGVEHFGVEGMKKVTIDKIKNRVKQFVAIVKFDSKLKI